MFDLIETFVLAYRSARLKKRGRYEAAKFATSMTAAWAERRNDLERQFKENEDR